MSLFKTMSISVLPRNAGTFTSGRWVETAGTPRTILGTIQPLSGKEREALPEGRRTKASAKIYTSDTLTVLGGSQNPDRISWDGITYEVLSVETRSAGVINHNKYTLVELT